MPVVDMVGSNSIGDILLKGNALSAPCSGEKVQRKISWPFLPVIFMHDLIENGFSIEANIEAILYVTFNLIR